MRLVRPCSASRMPLVFSQAPCGGEKLACLVHSLPDLVKGSHVSGPLILSLLEEAFRAGQKPFGFFDGLRGFWCQPGDIHSSG